MRLDGSRCNTEAANEREFLSVTHRNRKKQPLLPFDWLADKEKECRATTTRCCGVWEPTLCAARSVALASPSSVIPSILVRYETFTGEFSLPIWALITIERSVRSQSAPPKPVPHQPDLLWSRGLCSEDVAVGRRARFLQGCWLASCWPDVFRKYSSYCSTHTCPSCLRTLCALLQCSEPSISWRMGKLPSLSSRGEAENQCAQSTTQWLAQ